MSTDGLNYMPLSHEASAWCRLMLQQLQNAYDEGLPACEHIESGAPAIMRAWDRSRAVCAGCAGDLCAIRDTCDRCGGIGSAWVGRHIYDPDDFTVAFALCGNCWSCEWDWQAVRKEM